MWRIWLARDLKKILIAAILVAGIFVVAIWFPNWRHNFGFGPEWSCTNMANSEPICAKR